MTFNQLCTALAQQGYEGFCDLSPVEESTLISLFIAENPDESQDILCDNAESLLAVLSPSPCLKDETPLNKHRLLRMVLGDVVREKVDQAISEAHPADNTEYEIDLRDRVKDMQTITRFEGTVTP